jgi:Holliday junction DNA helicase RuvA
MIALVAGEVAGPPPDHVVLETASGVGYRLNVSGETLKHVPAAGGTVSLHAHLAVREDALTLYGFATEAERDLFLLLLGVQSVGPKVAQAILGTASPRELVGAVVSGDAKAFQAAPGVGKRTAERIIVELRDKVGGPDSDLDVLPAGAEVTAARGDDPRLLARDGLVELGYTLPEAVAMLAGIDGDTAEELLAQALRGTRS